MSEVKHVTPDDARNIQMAVHAVAQEWFRRGLCWDCTIRQIIIAAACVAQDARKWPAEAVHDSVDEVFSADATHHRHHRH